MGYNHAKAQREFYEEWRKKLRLYKKAGMSMKQILAIYKYDKAVFRSDRRFYEHCEQLYDDENNPLLAKGTEDDFDSYSMDNWMKALPDKLCKQLEKLPAERLKAFYLYKVYGYTQTEISSFLLKPQQTISRWIVQITEIVDNFRKNG